MTGLLHGPSRMHPPPSPRVSIVDDDASVCRALTRLLRSAGYETHAFLSAEEFLESPDADDPACLILDVHLPGRSGLELQADLVSAQRAIPVVFITAFQDEATRDRALASGALAFLRKPLDAEELLEVVARVVPPGS